MIRRWTLLLVISLLLLTPLHALAQDDVTFSRFQVDLWPEYDRPEMLVLYRMELADDTDLPAQISLRIPRSAGTPFNLAMQEMDGQLYNLTYTQEDEGDWSRVTFTTASRVVQLEYYEPIQKDGSQRTYTYNWPGDYEVIDMLLRIQQPSGASQMKISPDMGLPTSGEDGLSYYLETVGQVTRGTPFSVDVQYVKETDELSTTGMQSVQPNAPITPPAGEGNAIPSWLLIVLVAVGVALVAGGGTWLFFSTRSSREKPVRRARHSSRHELAEARDEVIYCRQCGKKANETDIFCRSCGTRL